MKKKLLVSLLLSATVGSLVACTPSQNQSTGDNQSSQAVEQDEQLAQATVVITFADKTTEKEVTFEVGDSVMDVLEDHFAIEEVEGMVTAIDGVSQDVASNTYWMYKVNDEMAEVGAEDFELKAGDKIEFYLEKF